MSVDKVLSGDEETVLFIPAIETGGIPFLVGATQVPISAPTTAVLNYWAGVLNESSANFGAGGNVTLALKDDMKLVLADSSADADRSIIAVGDAQNLTFFNFTADFTIFRDQNVTSNTSAFNMAKNLVRVADIPYVIVHRIGKPHTAAFAVGDEIDLYYAWTDTPVDVRTDGANLMVKQTFITKNTVNISYTLTV